MGTFKILNVFIKQTVLLHLRHPVLQNWGRACVWDFCCCGFVNARAGIATLPVWYPVIHELGKYGLEEELSGQQISCSLF